MSQPIVPSITDEQLANLVAIVEAAPEDWRYKAVYGEVIARLRAAEKDAARYRWLRTRAYGHFRADELYDLFSFNDEVIDVMVDEIMEQKP